MGQLDITEGIMNSGKYQGTLGNNVNLTTQVEQTLNLNPTYSSKSTT